MFDHKVHSPIVTICGVHVGQSPHRKGMLTNVIGNGCFIVIITFIIISTTRIVRLNNSIIINHLLKPIPTDAFYIDIIL